MLRSILSYFTVGGTTIATFIRDVEDAMQGPQSDNLTESQLYQLETDVAKFKSDVDLYSSNYVKFYERLEQAARLEDDLITESEQYVTIASEILYGIHTLFQTTFMSASRDTFTTFDKLYTDNTNLRHLTQAIIDTVTEHVIATKDSIVTLDDENGARIAKDTAHTVYSVLSETYHELSKESDVLYTHIADQLKGLQSINTYRKYSNDIEELLEMSNNIQLILLRSPFNLPAELFVVATSKETGQWVEQLSEQIGNVYKEYISPDRITNAFNDSDTAINAINTQGRLTKLKELEKLLLMYEGVYQSIVDDNFSGGRSAYDDDVDSNPDVVVEREKITNMLITVFDIDRTLFQIEQPIESEDVIRAKAQEMSIWLNLMPTKSAGNTTYNSGFVDSITSKTSFTTTTADIARENWDNFNIAYTAMQEGVLSTQLIAMMEQFKSTNPAVESISTDPLGTNTLKEIIRDWLTEMGLVDPNILAYTTITRADMKTPNINSLYTSWDTYKKDLFYVAKEISSMCLIVNDINKMKRGKNTSNVAIVNPFGKLSSNLTIEFFIERIKALNNGRRNGHDTQKTDAQAEISVLENAQILAGQIIGLDKADESAWRNQRTTSVSIAVTSSKCISTLKTSVQNNSQNKYLQILERYKKLEAEYRSLLERVRTNSEDLKKINELTNELQRMQDKVNEHESARKELDKDMEIIHTAQTKELQTIKLLREIKTEINNNLNNSSVKQGARAFEVLNFGTQIAYLFNKLDEADKKYKSWLTTHLRSDSSMQITPILLQIDRTVAELSATYNEAKKVFDEKKAYKANLQESINAVNKSIAQKQILVDRSKETIASSERYQKAAIAKDNEINRCIAEISEQEGTLLLQMSSVLKTMKDNKISVSPDFIAVFTELLR
jgi:tetratricopeptide (TPR) repeat protein